MKKKEKKELEAKLIVAVKRVMTTNNAVLNAKIEKTLKKSIKAIVKKSKKKVVAIKKPVAAK